MNFLIAFISISYTIFCAGLGFQATHWLIKERVVSSLVDETFSSSELGLLKQLNKLRFLLNLQPLDLSTYKYALNVLTKEDQFLDNIKYFPFYDPNKIESELAKVKMKLEREKKIESLNSVRSLLASLLGVSDEAGSEITYVNGVLAGLPSLLVIDDRISSFRELRNTLNEIASENAPIWGYSQEELLKVLEKLREDTENALRMVKTPTPELPDRLKESLRAQVQSYLIENTDKIGIKFF